MESAARVLIIYPNINTQEGFNHGIAALSGALKAAGAEVELLNLNDTLYDLPSNDQILARTQAFDPDLICLSAAVARMARSPPRPTPIAPILAESTSSLASR